MRWNEVGRSLRVAARQSLAVGLACWMVSFTEMQVSAQGYAPLGADQLNQLVAPIALYPDPLVAQVLTASTFPQQVSDADNYVHQYGAVPPQQLAAQVDGLAWDPSVKALTAFPSVLDIMTRNIGWTTALGNAYFNQPADVMNAVQAMRFQASQAGNLRTSQQLSVYNDNTQILVTPVNPAYVYVPYYNPWGVWGVPVTPYPGFYWAAPVPGLVYVGLLGFAAVAIGVGFWAHYHWGWGAWSPNWHGGGVFFNRGVYVPPSRTVFNRGGFGGFNRGVYEHAGAGVPRNFHAPVTAAAFHSGVGAARPAGGGAGGFNHLGAPGAPGARPAAGQFQGHPAVQAAHPAAVARPQAQAQAHPQMQARPQMQAHPQQMQAHPQAQAQARPQMQAHPQAQARPQMQARPAAPAQHAAPAAHPAPAAHRK